jgi:hypothetical protein
VTILTETGPKTRGRSLVLKTTVGNLVPFLFGPFWWTLDREPILWLSALSTLVFWPLLALAAYGTYSFRSKAPVAVILLWGFASLIIFSVALTNYGLIIRFRQFVGVVVLPLAVVGLSMLLAKMQLTSTEIVSKRRKGTKDG